jgi:hypothetical protein
MVKFGGDTLIGAISFNKVFQTSDSTLANWSMIGWIREDTAHRVYYFPLNDTAEFLLYDFDVHVGDTVKIRHGLYQDNLVVDSVDSVFIYNTYVKRISLSWGMEKWYEGIGSSCGILYSGYGLIVGSRNDLLCYSENDTVKYANPQFNDCYMNYTITGSESITEENGIAVVFPNPVISSSTLKIEDINGGNFSLEIFDVVGQLIRKTIISGQYSINKGDFDSGIYIYRVSGSDGVATGRFVVE